MGSPQSIEVLDLSFYDNETLQEIGPMCRPDAFRKPVAVMKFLLDGKTFAIKIPIIVREAVYGYYKRTFLQWLFHEKRREAKREEFDFESTAEDVMKRATKYNLTLQGKE